MIKIRCITTTKKSRRNLLFSYEHSLRLDDRLFVSVSHSELRGMRCDEPYNSKIRVSSDVRVCARVVADRTRVFEIA